LRKNEARPDHAVAMYSTPEDSTAGRRRTTGRTAGPLRVPTVLAARRAEFEGRMEEVPRA